MIGCAVPTCGAFLCEECATETEWELEGCCDEHAAAMASRLRQRLAAAQAALRNSATAGGIEGTALRLLHQKTDISS